MFNDNFWLPLDAASKMGFLREIVMHCHHCGFAVTAAFQFCPKCGNKLRRDCPTCGYVCSPGFRLPFLC
jgi:predicted amidophosphoribosyltransferase